MRTPPETCPGCGGRVEPGQEYCLHCGARVAPAPRVSAFGQAWERKLGRYPGDWIWASLLLLLVAAGSATAGIVAARDTSTSRKSRTIVATSRIVAARPPKAARAPRRSTPTKTKPAARPPSARLGQALAEWPGRNGYTIVLASIPARGSGRDDAIAAARNALARGLRDVGVLDSGQFASLHPGYYVVFAGVYDSLQDAETAASRVSPRFPNAYARQISR
jgi:hypothetical protein